MSGTHINFGELVAAYYENLNENLRHFRGGPGFLETWVHDEDPGRSLLGILDLAFGERLAELKIELGPEVAAGLNLEWLRRETSQMGSLQLIGTELVFRPGEKLEREDEFSAVHPAYRASLAEGARKLKHSIQKGERLPESPGEIWRTAEAEGALLHLRIDPSHRITAGFHSSAGLYSPLLDRLVELVVGLPLQEATEHGLIRLEKSLRNSEQPLPVKGVITPENADPCFDLPRKLLRALQPAEAAANAWRQPLPSWWASLDESGRMLKCVSALKEGLEALKLVDPGIELIAIKGDHRLIITYPAIPANKYWHYHLIELEAAVRKVLGFAAEIQCEDIADRNRRVERTNRSEA